MGRNPEEYLSEKVRLREISREDADIIHSVLMGDAGEKGYADHTVASNLRYMVSLLKVLPNPSSWTTAQLSQRAAQVRTRYKPNTARKHVILMKQLARSLVEVRINTKIDLDKINRIKAPAADRLTKTASQMLTESQILDLIKAGKNSRDRALLAVEYEGGFRPVELLKLKWSDIKFDEYGAVINTDAKTGKPRYIRLIVSKSYLSAWKSDHILGAGPDTPVFCSLKTPHEAIGPPALKKIIKEAAKRAGIDKRVHPYLLRHCRVSHMLEQEIPESVIKLQHWGSLNTPMLGTYGHITNKAIDDALLSRAGIIRKEKKEPQFKPGICPECGAVNKPTAKYCENCGHGVNESAEVSRRRARREIMDDPEIIRAIVREEMEKNNKRIY